MKFTNHEKNHIFPRIHLKVFCCLRIRYGSRVNCTSENDKRRHSTQIERNSPYFLKSLAWIDRQNVFDCDILLGFSKIRKRKSFSLLRMKYNLSDYKFQIDVHSTVFLSSWHLFHFEIQKCF